MARCGLGRRRIGPSAGLAQRHAADSLATQRSSDPAPAGPRRGRRPASVGDDQRQKRRQRLARGQLAIDRSECKRRDLAPRRKPSRPVLAQARRAGQELRPLSFDRHRPERCRRRPRPGHRARKLAGSRSGRSGVDRRAQESLAHRLTPHDPVCRSAALGLARAGHRHTRQAGAISRHGQDPQRQAGDPSRSRRHSSLGGRPITSLWPRWPIAWSS